MLNLDPEYTVEQFNKLIAVNRGISNVYQSASERLQNETNKALLTSYATEHEAFTAQLSDVVVSLSGNRQQTSLLLLH